jgi:hypothetical protein
MADGTATLDRMIATLRALPETVRGTMPEIAEAVKAELAKNVAAQQSPNGEGWPATKSGKPALTGAAAKITYSIHGTAIVFQLDGVEARHSLGWVKGGRRRQILPETYHEPSARAAAKAVKKALAKAAKLAA